MRTAKYATVWAVPLLLPTVGDSWRCPDCLAIANEERWWLSFVKYYSNAGGSGPSKWRELEKVSKDSWVFTPGVDAVSWPHDNHYWFVFLKGNKDFGGFLVKKDSCEEA